MVDAGHQSRMVVVFSGHLTDAPDRPEPRFPERLAEPARVALARALDAWRIGADDLAICGGARGGDILFAEECLARGAALHLSLPLPLPRFLDLSVRADSTDWEERLFVLFANAATTMEIHDWPDDAAPEPAFVANNQRMVARAAAAGGQHGFLALLLWDEPSGDPTTGGAAHFAGIVRGLAREIAIVNPLRLSRRGDLASD